MMSPINEYHVGIAKIDDPRSREIRQIIRQCRIGNFENLDTILGIVGYSEEYGTQGRYPFDFDGELELYWDYGIPISAVIDWLGESLSNSPQQIEE